MLPLDKDYILDILDDVFFYIKQGSRHGLMQNLSFAGRMFPMTNFCHFGTLFHLQLRSSLLKPVAGTHCLILGQVQAILFNFASKPASDHLDQLHRQLQPVPPHRLRRRSGQMFQRLQETANI